MTTRTIQVKGLNELVAKCDWDVLVQPEMEGARDTFVERFQRQGKGLGAQRNTLGATTRPLGATVETTLNYPRTVGTAWARKNEGIAKAMSPRVFGKVISRIEQRWGEAS